MSYPNVSPGVIVSITFGIVMFLLAVISIWQGRKHRCDCRSGESVCNSQSSYETHIHLLLADEEDQCRQCWPVLSTTGGRRTADNLLAICSSFNTYKSSDGTHECSSIIARYDFYFLKSSSIILVSQHTSLPIDRHHLQSSHTKKTFHSCLHYLLQLI